MIESLLIRELVVAAWLVIESSRPQPSEDGPSDHDDEGCCASDRAVPVRRD